MRFHYTAYREHIRKSGWVVAETIDQAASQLTADGFLVTRLRENATRQHWLIGTSHPELLREEKIFLAQNLATFLDSGMPLLDALVMITADTPSQRLRNLMEGVIFDLKTGTALSTSLKKDEASFDTVFIALVEAGESSGKLAGIFYSLAEKMKQEAQTVSRIRSALAYPAVVVGALFLLGVLLTFFVLPRITVIFTDLHLDLPLLTRMLLATSRLMTTYPLVSIGGLLLLLGSARLFLRSLTGKRTLYWLGSHLPIAKNVFWFIDLQRFTSTLGILVKAGIPIQDGILIAGRTVHHPVLARQIPEAAEALAGGQSLATVLGQTELPRTVISLLAVGEQSGSLSRNLEGLEKHYREQLDEALRNLTGLVEPILTLFVGVVIGLVVIAIIVPIYQLVGQIGPRGT